ncbi:nucleotidyltransferase domain-containing protein [candidate division KSB1 bacterium]|nr:nucleotidyltransferase domain-containing protein [candidate division KSB1 bacterium]
MNQKLMDITQTIVKYYKPEKIILFGSYAEGNPSPESDLDLLIIKQTNTPIRKRTREIRKYLRGAKIGIDLLVYTQNEIDKWLSVETAFTTQILKKGILLYDSQKGINTRMAQKSRT